MKLYSPKEAIFPETSLEKLVLRNQDDIQTLNQDFHSLSMYTKTYSRAGDLQDQIAKENFNLVNKNNYHFYQQYLSVICENIDIKPNTPSLESLRGVNYTAVNHQFALEGFLGNLWAKIKAIFKKIYEKIKQFFTTYFTRLGRLKNKLKNLEEAIAKSNKGLKKASLDEVPSSLANKYPFARPVTISVVSDVFSNVVDLSASLKVINVAASSFASKDILSKNFVAEVQQLKARSKQAGETKEENEKNMPGRLKSAISKDSRQERERLQSDNKSLTEIQKNADAKVRETEQAVDKVNEANSDLDVNDEDKTFQAAKEEFNKFMGLVQDSFKDVVKKPLVGGKFVESVKLEEDSGIEININDNKEKPENIILGDKNDLLKLLKYTSSVINGAEVETNKYVKINDTIMKNVDAIDAIVASIDKLEDPSLVKYKNIINTKVRKRLNILKQFFQTYNTINKTVYGMLIDSAEGNCEYAVVSLKYYG